MLALKAHVKDGRLVLDEPTDLPEGAEVDIAVLGNDLSPDERAARIGAMLDRWATEDVANDPDWDVQDIQPAKLHTSGSDADKPLR
ncbi:MAG TPA: hypothetical protein VIV58_15765 [Kofleriaceae bacterium]